jgi:hypothetical protein
MRLNASRVLATATVFLVSGLLLACPIGRLRMVIPDFETSAVRGVQLLRVEDGTGDLVEAGAISFVGLESDAAEGEVLVYRQVDAEGKPSLGPLRAPVVRDPEQPEAIQIEVSFLNELEAGWFRVASYNGAGTSGPSSTQAYIGVSTATH